MKALTLHRPWDQLILFSGKNVENRSWSTNHRGDLLIHGGKSYDPDALHVAVAAGAVIPLGDTGPNLSIDSPQGIVGVVSLDDVCTASRGSDRLECDCGPWAFPGQCHWKVSNPRPFPQPIVSRGAQQLWTPAQNVLDALPEMETL